MFEDAERSKIYDFCCEFHIKQLINSPARVTPISSTCIDLVLTSHPDNITVSNVIPLGLSDHSMVLVNRKTNVHIKVPPKVSKLRNFKNFDENQFLSELFDMPWEHVQDTDDIDEAWDIWEQMFNEACDRNSPKK